MLVFLELRLEGPAAGGRYRNLHRSPAVSWLMPSRSATIMPTASARTSFGFPLWSNQFRLRVRPK